MHPQEARAAKLVVESVKASGGRPQPTLVGQQPHVAVGRLGDQDFRVPHQDGAVVPHAGDAVRTHPAAGDGTGGP